MAESLRGRADGWPPVVAIVGPTGVGKSWLAMELADRFDAEIISADSRQVYRYLDIGTAKPSVSEQARVRHHLLDLVDPDGVYTVVDFCRDARAALTEIRQRGKVAFVVGGSGYYVRALVQGLTFPEMTFDPKRAAAIEDEIREQGPENAVAEIEAIDPATAARLDTANPRRVARALEVIRTTAKPIPVLTPVPLDALVIGLTQDRDRLYERVDRRVESQVAAGLPAETQSVLDRGFSPELPVMKGLAYGQMVKLLSGAWTLDQAVEAYKSVTHSLIRRQETWFRREPRLTRLPVDSSGLVTLAGSAIKDYMSSRRAR